MHIYRLIKDEAGHKGIQCLNNGAQTISWSGYDIAQKYCRAHNDYFTTIVDSKHLGLKNKLKYLTSLLFNQEGLYHLVRDFDCPKCSSSLIARKVKPKTNTKVIVNKKEKAIAWLNQ